MSFRTLAAIASKLTKRCEFTGLGVGGMDSFLRATVRQHRPGIGTLVGRDMSLAATIGPTGVTVRPEMLGPGFRFFAVGYAYTIR